MICKQASYRCFRNIEEEKISFSPGINLIIGDNAQGKTNALEGIWLMAGGRSHRAARMREMIGSGFDFAKVGLIYENSVRQSELTMDFWRSGRRVCRKNGLAVPKMSEFIGNFRAVLFTPEHLAIVKQGPALRREFLDSAIGQLSPVYVAALQAYNRILIQRNRLLSDLAAGKPERAQISPSADALDVWDDQLAAQAEILSAARDRYISRLNELVGQIFSDMTLGAERIEVRYKERTDKSGYLAALSAARPREISLGLTLAGIHRDDLDITLNGRPIRAFGSQGQQRFAAVAMKIAEGEISKEQSGEYPVFLFDDILSELDDNRKSYLLSGLSSRQVLITACDPISTPTAHVIRCVNGHYE